MQLAQRRCVLAVVQLFRDHAEQVARDGGEQASGAVDLRGQAPRLLHLDQNELLHRMKHLPLALVASDPLLHHAPDARVVVVNDQPRTLRGCNG